MRRLRHLLRQPALHVLLFGVGLVLVTWPILGILYGRSTRVVVGYFAFVWLTAIGLLGLISWACSQAPPEDEP